MGCWEDDSGLRREGSGMCLAYSWHRSLELLRRQEARRGRRYALLVQTRFDFVWGRPHPVAAEFPGEFLWVPEGNDWGGVNDRHAVMHRSVADAYLGSGWHDLLSGAAARQLRRRLGARRALNCTRHRGSDEEAPCATHELWLQLRLLARSVVVRRFEAHADIYRAESGMLECARGAALATNTDCLRRVAARAIRSLGIANSTTSQAKVWAKIERWCVLHRRDEAETRFLGGPPTHCEAVLVDMLMSEEARRRNRPRSGVCAGEVMQARAARGRRLVCGGMCGVAASVCVCVWRGGGGGWEGSAVEGCGRIGSGRVRLGWRQT